MKFEISNPDFMKEFKKNKTKSIVPRSIIQYKNVHWYVKIKDEKAKYKEILASKIAHQLGLNTVEIIEVNEDDIDFIKKIDTVIENILTVNKATHKNTYLVRMAQSYAEDNLSIKNIDEAVASELVFSLWIRRRDAHFDNRWIINNIPVFFDFHAAFDSKEDVNKFFQNGQRENGKYRDCGYAGCWRVKIGEYTEETIKEIKKAAKALQISYHLIKDSNNFDAQLNKYCKKIEQYDIEKLFNDFDDEFNIKQLLIKTKETIKKDCDILRGIIKKDYKY